MNKITAFLIILTVVLSFSLGTTIQSKAQTKSFIGIIPFATGSNHIGFLDQNTGRVYVYDENINKCLFTGQIQGLGRAIQIINQPTNE